MSDERERTYPWEHPWPGPGSGSIVPSWGQDCHDTEVSSSRCLSLSQKILFQGNQKCEPFRVIFKSLYILFDDCHLLASVPSLKICRYLFKYISKSFYLVCSKWLKVYGWESQAAVCRLRTWTQPLSPSSLSGSSLNNLEAGGCQGWASLFRGWL